MRSLLGLLLLLAAVTADSSKGSGEYSLNDVLALTNLIQSIVPKIEERSKIICSDVSQRGAYAACPADSTAVSCSCGSACGSYDIQPENKCHCQCANIDWTSAHCCKIGLK